MSHKPVVEITQNIRTSHLFAFNADHRRRLMLALLDITRWLDTVSEMPAIPPDISAKLAKIEELADEITGLHASLQAKQDKRTPGATIPALSGAPLKTNYALTLILGAVVGAHNETNARVNDHGDAINAILTALKQHGIIAN